MRVILRVISSLILILLLLILGGQLFLPSVISDVIERGFSRKVDSVEYIRVEVHAVPAILLLAGRADHLVLETRKMTVSELPVAAFVFEADNVVFNPRQLWLQRELVYEYATDVSATLVFDQRDLNEYFWEKIDPEKFFQLELIRNQASLVGKVSVLGREIELSLRGSFFVSGPQEVTFVPKGASVQQTEIPAFLLDAILREKRLVLPLDKLPVPIVVEDVRIEDGRLFLYGTKPSGRRAGAEE